MAAFKLMEHKNRYNLLCLKNVPYIAQSQLHSRALEVLWGLRFLFLCVLCEGGTSVGSHCSADKDKIKQNKPSDLLNCKGDT